MIFSELLCNDNIKNLFKKNEINILDIGSGTGGNLLGLLWSMKNSYENFEHKNIYIVSIDGNDEALNIQKKLIEKFFSNNVTFHSEKHIVNKKNMYRELNFLLNRSNLKFDVIMSVKFINEVYRKEYSINRGMYKLLTEIVSNYLNNDGLFILADVTDRIMDNDFLFLPKIMNMEIFNYLNNTNAKLRAIIPLSCAFWYGGCTARDQNCFTQRKFQIRFNCVNNYNNRKMTHQNEITKLTYKVFAHKTTTEMILDQIDKKTRYNIAEGKACIEGKYNYKCSLSNNAYADAFTLNTFK